MNIVSRLVFRYSHNRSLGTVMFFYYLWMASLVFRSIHGVDDFDVFLDAARRFVSGENMYGPPHFNQLKYYYSPLFALLLSPFVDYPVMVLKTIWFAINYLLLLRCCRIMAKYTRWDFRGAPLVLLVLCICSGKLVMYNFLANQLTILILWSLMESFNLYKKNMFIPAILVFCIGLNFKIMPILVLPFYALVVNMRYKLLFPVFTICLLLLPACFIEWDYHSLLLRSWWGNINPSASQHVVQTSEDGFLDIGALITKYGSSARVDGERAVNLADMGYWPVFILTNMMRLLLVCASIFISRRISGPLFGIDRDLLRITPFIALLPLLLPHQRDYSYLLMMPLLLVLSLSVVQLKKIRHLILLILMIALSGILAWSTIVGSILNDVFYTYRLITIGMSGFLLFYFRLMFKQFRTNVLTSSKVVQK
jgi:hypothetical protein